MKVLVTGGAGFIGSNLVLWLRRERPDVAIVNVDLLTYAGNLENLAALEGDEGHAFVRADVADRPAMEAVFAAHRPQGVLHLAAESHVDRSILDATPFVRNNVAGTQVLLDLSRAHGVRRYLQVSTDEVYGEILTDKASEEAPLLARNPYAASKIGGDRLAYSYHATHGFPAIVTRCSNNYGPFQFPEKLIPLMIVNALEDRPLPVYGDGLQVRDWLHVEDHCAALWTVFERGRPGSVYNVGGDNERANLDVVRLVLREVGKSEALIRYVQDRPGHDRRYAIDARRLRDELGWAPRRRFEEALPATVRWYIEHRDWWQRVRSGAYRDYYQRQYGARGA